MDKQLLTIVFNEIALHILYPPTLWTHNYMLRGCCGLVVLNLLKLVSFSLLWRAICSSCYRFHYSCKKRTIPWFMGTLFSSKFSQIFCKQFLVWFCGCLSYTIYIRYIIKPVLFVVWLSCYTHWFSRVGTRRCDTLQRMSVLELRHCWQVPSDPWHLVEHIFGPWETQNPGDISLTIFPLQFKFDMTYHFVLTTSWYGNIFHIAGPLRKGTHQSLVDSPHKGPVILSFDVCSSNN